MEKLTYQENFSTRFKIIKRHETELKWIKFLQTRSLLGFNDNIYQEGNISKMANFGISETWLKTKGKRKKCVVKITNTSLKHLPQELKGNGRHSMLPFLSSLPISILRVVETEANKFYNRNHLLYDPLYDTLYDAALLTRYYTQHALLPFIDTEINHKRHFIKVPFMN